MSHTEIITRRRLPHWYTPGAAHFVTFRLAGSLPRAVLDRLRLEKEQFLARKPKGLSPALHRYRVHKQLFASYDAALDASRTICWLSDERIANIVRDSLYFLHDTKYHLLSWCIMSNHVHVLFIPRIDALPADHEPPIGESADARSPLAKTMHSLKSFTAHEANRVLGRTGSFWQRVLRPLGPRRR